MRHLGYIAGQTFDIDYRYADGDTQRLRPLAQELISLSPDVLFAGEPSAARAVKAIAPELLQRQFSEITPRDHHYYVSGIDHGRGVTADRARVHPRGGRA